MTRPQRIEFSGAVCHITSRGNARRAIFLPEKAFRISDSSSSYYVDPNIARHNIPSKWKVKIHDNGKALLLVMV